MSKTVKKIILLGGLVGLIIASPFAYYLWIISVGQNLLTSVSPKRWHVAVLRRKVNLADFNFKLAVDGKTVFVSPDLCSSDYGEQVVWDESGEKVLLYVLGKRVFAYDAQSKTELGKGQIGDFELRPWIQPKEVDCAYLKDIEE